MCTTAYFVFIKRLSPHMRFLIQLETENANLNQKLSKFSCYSIVPKPIDPPDKADFIAAKFAVYKAKLEASKLVSQEKKEYLESDECCNRFGGLLSIMSKTFLNFIEKNKDLLHGSFIDWFNASITKDRHKRNVDHLYFFMQQVMAGLIPSTCFPEIDLPEDIYLNIVDQHKNACMTGTTR